MFFLINRINKNGGKEKMEQVDAPSNRDFEVENYHARRKREREEQEKKRRKGALKALKEVYKFYKEHYPTSEVGITHDEKKITNVKEATLECSREEAINLRKMIEYFKLEKQVNMGNTLNIGHAIYLLNQNIPDRGKLNKIIKLESQKKEIDRQIWELKNMKETLEKPLPEKPKKFNCNYCGEEFKNRGDILEHILICKKRPNIPEDEPEREPEKLFKCDYCGIELPKAKLLKHITTCKKEQATEEEPNYVCPLCDKDCKNGAGLASHMKTHEKEE